MKCRYCSGTGLESKHAFNPDWCINPGVHIREHMQLKKLTQRALAKRMKRPEEQISRLLHGKIELTAETAMQLEKALGSRAEYWMNLETNFRVGLLRGRKWVK